MSKAARLRAALLKLHREHKAAGMLPTSARFLFYELISQGIISKRATGARRADQDMIDQLTNLRESGDILWEDIIDETRSIENFTGYKSIRGAVVSVLEQLELDPWGGRSPIVLTESRSLTGVLRPIANEYRIEIASTNGQCAGFLHNEVAPRCGERRVLYLGDLDFGGGHIEANTRRIVNGESGGLGDWERIAVTDEQVKQYNLTVIQKYDKRDKKEHNAVETEALSQGVIVALLRARLDELLPRTLKSIYQRERTERRAIRRLLGAEA